MSASSTHRTMGPVFSFSYQIFGLRNDLFDRPDVYFSILAHHRENMKSPSGFERLLREWYIGLELWNESVTDGASDDDAACFAIHGACDTRHICFSLVPMSTERKQISVFFRFMQ